MANEFKIKNGLKVNGIVEVRNQTGSTNTASIKEVTGGSALSSTGTLTLSSNGADYIKLDGGYLSVNNPTIFDTRIFGTTSEYTALYAYTGQTQTATSSSASVYGANIAGVLATGAFNNTANYGLIGSNVITAAYGNAGTSIANVRGVLSAVSEQSNGTITNGIGYDSEFYGNFTNYYGFRQRPSSFGTVTNAYGFYSEIPAGATSYNFYAAGTAQNYFSGNVGIGVTVPTEKFEVNGNIKITADYSRTANATAVTISGTTMTVTAMAGTSPGAFKVGDQLYGDLIQPFTRITAFGTGTGGVGTYTVSVSQTMASTIVRATDGTMGNLRLVSQNTSEQAGQPNGKIEFFTNDPSAPGPGVSAYIGTVAENASPDTALVFGTRDNVGGGVDANERMRITSTGNVGIGTTTPTEKLSIVGGISATSGITAPAFTSSLDPAYNVEPAGFSQIKNLYVTTSNTTNGFVQLAEDYIFGADLSNVNTFLLSTADHSYVKTSFNMGIGTNTPTEKLEVVGNIKATTINKVTITTPATGSTLTIADGKTATINNTLTLTGTDASSIAFGTGGTVAYTGGTLAQFASTTSSQLLGVISDETGTGSLVFGTTPTFTTSIDSSATFAAFGSATSLTLGYNNTASNTTNIATGATASGATKTVNIATGAALGSTTNVTINRPNGSTAIRGRVAVGTAITLGPILTLGALTSAGSGYMNGTHTLQPLSTNGIGSQMQATVVVSGGTVQSITVTSGGELYAVGDVLTVPSLTTTLTTSSVSGTGSSVTLGFATQTTAPFQVGSQIITSVPAVPGASGTYTVTACSTSSVSYANNTLVNSPTAGTVKMGAALTNATIPVTAITSNYMLDVGGSARIVGNIDASGDIAAFSDARLKENIVVIDNALEKVVKMRGVYFNKIGEEKRSVGVIAQEIKNILPEVVIQNGEYKSVAYGNIVSILIEAIKDLKIIVENQQQEINILKGKIQ